MLPDNLACKVIYQREFFVCISSKAYQTYSVLLIREIYYNKSMDMQSKLNQRIEYHECKNARLKLHMRTKILLVWFILFPVVKCYMWYVLFNVIDFQTSYYSKQYKNYVSSSKIQTCIKTEGTFIFCNLSGYTLDH